MKVMFINMLKFRSKFLSLSLFIMVIARFNQGIRTIKLVFTIHFVDIMQDCRPNFFPWLPSVAHAKICDGGGLGTKKTWYFSGLIFFFFYAFSSTIFVGLLLLVIYVHSDVYIDVPDIIDISHMRSKGLQPSEELLPEGGMCRILSWYHAGLQA